MDDEKEYQSVILAALLHDVGKLLQRGSFFGSLNIKGKHPQVSSEFISAYSGIFSHIVDTELLKTLVQHHHENPAFPEPLRVDGIAEPHVRSLASLVSLADNFSASERGRRTEQWQDFKFTPLKSTMERVHIFSKSNEEKAKKTYSLHFRANPLKSIQDKFSTSIFPERFDKYAEDELNNLLRAFGHDFASWAKKPEPSDFDNTLCHLLHLFYKYTWCIPSNTQEEYPDISLFDHLKTTSAIAACLYLYHKDNKNLTEEAVKNPEYNRFYFVAGDISGIQKYIFAISNIGAGGIARKLRSRSLFVQLIAESCAQKILHEFKLPVTNILMSAGGNFYILIPHISKSESILKKINEEIDNWFLEKLNGEVALNLAHVELDGDGLKASSEKSKGFSEVFRLLGNELALSKQHRFSSVMIKGNHWQETKFLVNLDFKGQEACQSCGRFPQEEPVDRLCRHCSLDRAIGKNLPDRDIIAFYSDTGKGNIPLPYGSASLLGSIPVAGDNPYITVKLNSTDLSTLYQFPSQSKFLATYIPEVTDKAEELRLAEKGKKLNIKEDELPKVREPVTFELLASEASGRPYLGFLKMDADNMGQAIIFGLKREKAGLDTVSRLATLSREIEWFFAGWVQYLLSQDEKFKHCYAVFSGGDDLFIAGPWNIIIDLAGIISSDYTRYTGNLELTLSAGIIIANASYPISQAAYEAESAVEKSKNGGRDRVTLLGHTITWDEWSKVKEKWEELRTKLKSEKISSAFLYSLLEYGRMWQLYRKKGDIIGLRFQPLLAYNVGRNLNQKHSPTFYNWTQSIITLRLDEMQQKQIILDNLGLLAQLLILGKEGGKS